MRILVVTPRFLPETGGVELHVAEVGRRLAAAGEAVTVLTTDLSGRLPEVEHWEGVEIRRVRGYPRGRDYRFAPALYGVTAGGDWDVVHVQSFHTAVAPVAMLAALRARLPYVVTFHGGGHSSRLRTSLRRPQLAALRPLLARARALVAVAEFEIEHYGKLLRIPASRFALVPNGADLPPAELPAGGARPRPPLIASIGRLERYKGHQHVIAALPSILRRRPDARLWVAGTGPYEPRLQELVRRLGLGEAVEIRSIPPGDRQRMADEVSRVSVVVLASEFETHPLAALEAAALGCRVVVADSPGLRELAERGLARLADPIADAETVARVVVEELAQPATSTALSLPTWDDCANDLLALYRHVGRAA
jgi:glycosyltransferase involved in cell wall biosynthesis